MKKGLRSNPLDVGKGQCVELCMDVYEIDNVILMTRIQVAPVQSTSRTPYSYFRKSYFH